MYFILGSAALSGIGNIACFATAEDDPYISSKGEVRRGPTGFGVFLNHKYPDVLPMHMI